MCDIQLYLLAYMSARYAPLVACVREVAGSIPSNSFTNCQLLVKGLALILVNCKNGIRDCLGIDSERINSSTIKEKANRSFVRPKA